MKLSASCFRSFKTLSFEELKKGAIPSHVAVIMDGNGRWATSRGLPRIIGHKKGAVVLRETVITCKELGIKYLTAYSFSNENWQRPRQEVSELMELFVEVLEKELGGMIKNDVKLNLVGQREIIPPDILSVFENAEKKTENNKTLVFNIAFSYGSRQEIIQAFKKIAQLYKDGEIELKNCGQNLVENYLYTAGMPDPDLLIRTSGELRLSNFLLWQAAYTELYFTKTLWPDFNRKQFFLAVKDYQQRKRRFGRL